jgi:cytochrome c553
MVRICSLATMFIITFVTPQSQAASEGEELFDACRSCHMDDGMGSETLGAPAIAGLPEWYIAAQLEKFVKGQRGYHADDFYGMRMRPMASSMNHEGNVATVAAYVSALPHLGTPSTLSGDAELGKVAYITCVACHGADGMGNETLNSPPLKGQADWYMKRQLQNFKAGIRGTAPGDIAGMTMRPMSMTLADDAAMQNVIAYIKTL